MCMLALIPDNVPFVVITEFLKEWETWNKDGSGLAWVSKDGRLDMIKSEEGSRAFGRQLAQLKRDGWQGYLLLHTRTASTGEKDYESTQPISCADGFFAYAGHNVQVLKLRPVLEAYGETFKTNTDTEVLAKLYAKIGPQKIASFVSSGVFLFINKERAVVAKSGYKSLQMVKYNNSHIFASNFPATINRIIGVKKIYDCEDDYNNGFICSINHNDKKLNLISGSFKREVNYYGKKWWQFWKKSGKTKYNSYHTAHGTFHKTYYQLTLDDDATAETICESCYSLIEQKPHVCDYCGIILCDKCAFICNSCNRILCRDCYDAHILYQV